MSARWLSLALLGALGCAQGEAIPAGALDMAPNVGGLEQPIQGCERVFSPAPELVDATQAAAARWSAATGCDVHVGERGLAVAYRPTPLVCDGIEHPAALGNLCPSTNTIQVIDVYEHPEDLAIMVPAYTLADAAARTVLHEIGHALAGNGVHLPGGNVMAAGDAEEFATVHEGAHVGTLHENPGQPITTADLELVCAELPCAWMQPEE